MGGTGPPADPRNAIQTHIARLRDALGDELPLRTRSPGYVLEVSAEQVDAHRFDHLLDRAQERRDDPATARSLLQEALSLWRGPAYAEFADSVARTEALRLEERELVARQELARARLALGEAGNLVGELHKAVAEQPLREGFVELLMRALATVDRQADAADAYRAYRDHLAEETGLSPSRPVEELHEAILRGEPADAVDERRTDEAGATSQQTGRAAGTPAPIPTAPTSLVGREPEAARLQALLEQHRAVTVTGPGGVGKTRLAAEAADAHLAERCSTHWASAGCC